jgi:hypothetical protein
VPTLGLQAAPPPIVHAEIVPSIWSTNRKA